MMQAQKIRVELMKTCLEYSTALTKLEEVLKQVGGVSIPKRGYFYSRKVNRAVTTALGELARRTWDYKTQHEYYTMHVDSIPPLTKAKSKPSPKRSGK